MTPRHHSEQLSTAIKDIGRLTTDEELCPGVVSIRFEEKR